MADIIITAVLLCIVAGIIIYMRRVKKRGGTCSGCCSGQCGGCGDKTKTDLKK